MQSRIYNEEPPYTSTKLKFEVMSLGQRSYVFKVAKLAKFGLILLYNFSGNLIFELASACHPKGAHF